MKSKDTLSSAICSSCGYIYPNAKEIGTLLPEDRKPCPACGSTHIAFQINLNSQITIKSMLGLKSRRQGAKKPNAEIKTGDDLHWKSGRWMKLVRRIDRDNNRYTEKVIDLQTGKIIHETDEPLTDHRGHGSAK